MYQAAKTHNESLVEMRVRRGLSLDSRQGVQLQKSTKDIHLIRRLMGQYGERKSDVHKVFIDRKKAHDKVPRRVVWNLKEHP